MLCEFDFKNSIALPEPPRKGVCLPRKFVRRGGEGRGIARLTAHCYLAPTLATGLCARADQSSLPRRAKLMSSRRSMKGEARGAVAAKVCDGASSADGAGGKNPFQCVLDKENRPDGESRRTERTQGGTAGEVLFRHISPIG